MSGPAYRQQDPQQTLGQALQEYRSAVPDLVVADNLPAEDAAMFQAHDVCHVVFGCDTSPAGEIAISVWTLFGTTIRIAEQVRYGRSPEVTRIRTEYGYVRGMLLLLRELPLALRIAWRCRRMSRKWPLHAYQEFLDWPLRDIRHAFNIEVSTLS